jgi:HEAT repeat protein
MKRSMATACLYLMISAAAFGQTDPSARSTWHGKTTQQWIEQLADEDIHARWYATYAIGRIGVAAAPEAVAPLMEILRTRGEYEYVRGGSAWAIGRMGPAAEEAVPLLIETLQSKHISVLRNAPRALGDIGPAAKPAVEPLLDMLYHEDATARAAAAVALWQIDRHPKALPALEEMLTVGKDPQPHQAAVALGRLGPEAWPAVETLVKALGHADADTARAAAMALAGMGNVAIAPLESALTNPSEQVRGNAVEALGKIGAQSVPAIVEALADSSPAVRHAAARGLARLGPGAKTAESALIRAVNDPVEEVRNAAAKALAKVRAAPNKPQPQ